MRLVKIATGMAMVLSLTLAPLDAAPKGPKGPSSVKTSTKAPKVAKTTTAPKVTKAPKITTAKVTSAPKAKAPKTTTKVDTKLAKAEVKSAKKAGRTSTATESTTSATSTSGTATSGGTTTPTTIDFTKGAVAEKLAKNINLRTKLESRLQAAGYEGSVYHAAYGFKNQGQFIAATNVARNTGASFEQLKLQMTGLSVDAAGGVLRANLGTDGMITMVDPADVTNPAPTKSLGQAIKTVKSSVDATAAAQTATTQANAEIAATSTVSK
jgi:hypothetical protein